MIFTSQKPNIDPLPWYAPSGWNGEPAARFATEAEADAYGRNEYDPRDEFTPTRDPEPWLWKAAPGDTARVSDAEAQRLLQMGKGTHWQGMGLMWSPRREQFDTPVNQILVDFRAAVGGMATASFLARAVLRNWMYWHAIEGTPDEHSHAGRVLARLAMLP